MKDLCLYTLFESDGGRPRCTGIKIGDVTQIYDLYRPGARKTIYQIDETKLLVKELILRANSKGSRIILSDFKNHLRAFDLPLDARTYQVYDVHLPDYKPGPTLASDGDTLRVILNKLSNAKVKPYQKIIANAAVVYHSLEKQGIRRNYTIEHPIWSLKTYSGRSKCSGFSIQGFTEDCLILPPGASDRDVLIHFDWISADIRVASLLSGDIKLASSFIDSDPYICLMDELNRNSCVKISRDECKTFLLKSINSMDFTSVALSDVYIGLGEWIKDCQRTTAEPNGYLKTLLGRRFRVAQAKNVLAVLNGAMQGSVAHALQLVLRTVWERFQHRIIAENHDSLTVSSPPDLAEINATISAIAPIMLYPFNNILSDNPGFPVKVSIGKRWRKWRHYATYRINGVQYVKRPLSSEEESGEASSKTQDQSDNEKERP